MKIDITHDLPRLSRTIAARADRLSDPSKRRRLFARAAASCANLVRRHILRIAPARHTTADSLGAQPTEFLGKAARRTYHEATPNTAEVVIPSPGFSRAFHDVVIRPRAKAHLTIPKAAESYGHTAHEMRSTFGWKLFRPGKAKILIGVKDGRRLPLFALADVVHQRKDRSLLPSDAALDAAASQAILEGLVQ